MTLSGKNFIAGKPVDAASSTYSSVNPATQEKLAPLFQEATPALCDQAVQAAAAAHEIYRKKTPEQIAQFLEKIAEKMQANAEAIIERANQETALPKERLTGEMGRTTGQLKMFGALVRDGKWKQELHDQADPNRKPIPKPDLKRRMVPLGPVLVFAASNFPLAFSVAGGDTSSALAAGNSVVVKAHPAHPGTSELVFQAMLEAASECGMPPGVLSLLHSTGPQIGQYLTQHPLIKAVGFVGSLGAGRAIYNTAAARPIPIPVYSEMGSINPSFILPGALKERPVKLGELLAQSATLGVGQFCTNPGVIFYTSSEGSDVFEKTLAEKMSATAPGTMLYAAICQRFDQGSRKLSEISGVTVLARSSREPNAQKTEAPAMLFRCEIDTYLKEATLHEEVFGPSTLLVRCPSTAKMLEGLRSFSGQLTATLHAAENEVAGSADWFDALAQRVGRVILNGAPTGVEVSPAMVHGGPYPACTDSRSTGVGAAAIYRWVRPVCFQNIPAGVL